MVMGQLSTRADVAVIGAGPGGYTAAIRAAQLGLETVLIEKALMGGCCTNVGCIPSKALLHAAEVKHRAEAAGRMGIDARITLDFAKTQAWKDGVVKELRDGIATLCRLNGVEAIKGRACFTSPGTLSVETEEGLRAIEFRHAVIAAGTVAKELPGIRFDAGVIRPEGVFSLTQLPERLLIIGGGYVAVEMAGIFSRLGSKVALVHHGDRLLKRMEPEMGGLLLAKMREAGIEVLFNSLVERVEGGEAVVKSPDGTKRIRFDRLLVAAGRVPDLQGLGLEKTGVRLDEAGLIRVDSSMRTTDRNIFAVGDIVPGPQLAHKAFREGKVAAEVIAGRKSAFDNRAIPSVVFSDPEIASVGLTEGEAAKQGMKTVTGRMPYSASGRAKTLGATDGFVKVVAAENGMLLGAHVIGEGAGSVIAEAALAIEMAATLEDVAATIHAHPTLPEALAEAAEDALGRAIHLYRGKKH